MANKGKAHKANKGSSSMQHRSQLSGREGKAGKGGASWNKFPKNSSAKDVKTRDGCFPKLFILLLPFMTGVAFLLLRS